MGGTSSTNEIAREMPRPVASQPASSAFKPSSLQGQPSTQGLRPGGRGAARNSPMETSMPSRGAFGNATCRTDGEDLLQSTEALRFDQHNY